MKLLRSYLKRQRLWLLLLAAVSATLCLIAYLHGVSGSALGYGLLLSLFWMAVLIVPDFCAYRRRHRQLEERLLQLQTMTRQLPEPWDLVEADYQRLLHALHRQASAGLEECRRLEREMTDYYTLWVHQIKTPISAMHLLLQEEDTPRGHELSAQLFRIEQYVEMVLAYLRMDSSQTDYVFRSCDLNKLLRQSVRKLAPLFIQGKVQLQLQPVVLQAVTDEKWLAFAVEQLLSNAVKYTPQGKIMIYEEKESICIRDTGIGIAPEDLPRVCEKGFTGYHGRSHQKASGIGLYLCSEILQRLGHSLSLASEPGVGTTATITFSAQPRSFE